MIVAMRAGISDAQQVEKTVGLPLRICCAGSALLGTLGRSLPMDFDEIRRVTITALFSDEVMLEQLVLKGGNALSLVYGLTERTSLDLDFSMEADFLDIEDARRRLFHAVRDRLRCV